MDKKLVPSASTDETKVSCYKMKGDYYRYLAEFATGDEKGKAAEGACDACVEDKQDRRERFGRDSSCPFGHGTEFLGFPI